jgi:hypothetical protein
VTAPVVAWMFGQRLAGHSAARITRALNDAGIPCPSAADPKSAASGWHARSFLSRKTGRVFMNDEVRQAPPPDEELSEYWERLPGEEKHIRGVEVATGDEIEGWQVTIWAREYFRNDPLGLELARLIDSALRAVPGVTYVNNTSWETWDVRGSASGEAVCRVAANVVDELAGQMRAAYDARSY